MQKTLQSVLVVVCAGIASVAVTAAFLLFLPASLLLLSTGLIWWTIWELWKGRTSRHWPSTDGVVLSSTMEDRSTQMVSQTRAVLATRLHYQVPMVACSYKVEGVEYECHRPYYGADYRRFDIQKFASGARVPVYFNPDKPQESVLLPGCSVFPIVLVLPFSLLMVASALLVISANDHPPFFLALNAAAFLLGGLATLFLYRPRRIRRHQRS